MRTTAQPMLNQSMNVHSTSPARNSRKSHAFRAPATRAMTLVEIMCITVVLSVIVIVVVPWMARPRFQGSRIKCVNNLKNVGLAFRIFATDNSDLFPFQISTNNGGAMELTDIADHFRVLSNEISTPKIIICPSDYATKRRRDATNWISLHRLNISYYVGIDASETNAASILSGDTRFRLNGTNPPPGLSQLRASDSVAYPKKFHPESAGANILLGDGSVHVIGSKDLPKYLSNSRVPTNRFIVP
jgi:hypothetical protein